MKFKAHLKIYSNLMVKSINHLPRTRLWSFQIYFRTQRKLQLMHNKMEYINWKNFKGTFQAKILVQEHFHTPQLVYMKNIYQISTFLGTLFKKLITSHHKFSELRNDNIFYHNKNIQKKFCFLRNQQRINLCWMSRFRSIYRMTFERIIF